MSIPWMLSPGLTVIVSRCKGKSNAELFLFQNLGVLPGKATGGDSGPIPESETKDGKIASTSTVYVPGGTAIW